MPSGQRVWVATQLSGPREMGGQRLGYSSCPDVGGLLPGVFPPVPSGPAHNAANAQRLREQLARQEFASQAQWRTSVQYGNELTHHAYNRHPSLATNQRGLIDPQLYHQRAMANILNESAEIHHLSGTRYAAINSQTGEFTVFSWEGGGGLPVGSPTIHSYHIRLRDQMRTGVPFQSQGVVQMQDIRTEN